MTMRLSWQNSCRRNSRYWKVFYGNLVFIKCYRILNLLEKNSSIIYYKSLSYDIYFKYIKLVNLGHNLFLTGLLFLLIFC